MLGLQVCRCVFYRVQFRVHASALLTESSLQPEPSNLTGRHFPQTQKGRLRDASTSWTPKYILVNTREERQTLIGASVAGQEIMGGGCFWFQERKCVLWCVMCVYVLCVCVCVCAHASTRGPVEHTFQEGSPLPLVGSLVLFRHAVCAGQASWPRSFQ